MSDFTEDIEYAINEVLQIAADRNYSDTSQYTNDLESVNYLIGEYNKLQKENRKFKDLIATHDFPKKSDECGTCQIRRKIILDLDARRTQLEKAVEVLKNGIEKVKKFTYKERVNYYIAENVWKELIMAEDKYKKILETKDEL